MDFRQQQEQDELQAHLWFALCELRGHISAETFARAEREIGMAQISSGAAAARDSSNSEELFKWH